MECSICLEKIKDKELHKTKCNHCFHQHCINTWLEEMKKYTCPNCRKVIKEHIIIEPEEPEQTDEEIMEIIGTAMGLLDVIDNININSRRYGGLRRSRSVDSDVEIMRSRSLDDGYVIRTGMVADE